MPVEENRIERAAEHWRDHGWDGGPHFLASLAVIRAEEIIRTSNEAILKQYGLTHSRHEALAVLFFSKHGELPMGKLGESLMVHPTSVTFTVDGLEKAGLVERVPHPTDRRATLARVTARGREAMVRTSEALVSTQFGVASLSADDATKLYRILRKMEMPAPSLA